MSCYIIVSQLNGLVLDVERKNPAPGTHVITFHKKGKDHQLWYADPATGTIRSVLNGFCMDIEGDCKLCVMPFKEGDPNQQLYHDPQGYIRNRVNNRVLAILGENREKAASVGMWDAVSAPGQLWNIQYVDHAAPIQHPGQVQHHDPHHHDEHHHDHQQGATSAPRREFHIVSEMNSKVLDIKGGQAKPGAEIVMWSKNQPKTKNQLWYLDPKGFIRSALTPELAIDAAAGHKAVAQPFTGGQSQQWVADGKKITNKATGECLDIWGEKSHDGADVGSYRWKDSRNQHWRVEYV